MEKKKYVSPFMDGVPPNTVQLRHLFVEAGRGAGEAGEAGEERVNEQLVQSPPCLSTPPAQEAACLHESTSYLNRIGVPPAHEPLQELPLCGGYRQKSGERDEV